MYHHIPYNARTGQRKWKVKEGNKNRKTYNKKTKKGKTSVIGIAS